MEIKDLETLILKSYEELQRARAQQTFDSTDSSPISDYPFLDTENISGTGDAD